MSAYRFLATFAFLPGVLSVASSDGASECSTEHIPLPSFLGGNVTNFTAVPVSNYSVQAQPGVLDTRQLNYTGLAFCNVTVVYTHPGWNDSIKTQIWLPALDSWNGRFQGTGGGGFIAGYFDTALGPAISAGFAAGSTDAGLPPQPGAGDLSLWLLESVGNVNWELAENFGSKAVNEMTIIGKQVTAGYYGTPARYSYWNGCSQGGRQGLQMAQRYPDSYDGILIGAPAVNQVSIDMSMYWPQLVMNKLNIYPPQDELAAFTAAAIAECDGNDGLMDGLLADDSACQFNPYSIVGQPYTLNSSNGTLTQYITQAAAQVVAAAWAGPVDKYGRQWHAGLAKAAGLEPLVNTTQLPNGSYIGLPATYAEQWITIAGAKNPDFHIAQMTEQDYFKMYHLTNNQYESVFQTGDPDLTNYLDSGAKLIHVHGGADSLVAPGGSTSYYKEVQQIIPDLHKFYRYFIAPGVDHCGGGPGNQFVGELDALIDWVEKGIAPDSLRSVNRTLMAISGDDASLGRPVCPWPQVQTYIGGDPNVYSSFVCE